MTQTLTSSSGVVTFTVTNDDVHTIDTSTAAESITSWVPTASDGDHWTMYVVCASGHTVDWTGLADEWSGGVPPQMQAGNNASFGMMKVGSTVIGFTLGDTAFRYPKGLVWNDQSGTVPADNLAKIMDMLNNDGPHGAVIPMPPKDQWLDGGVGSTYGLFERLRIDGPIELETGHSLDGQDPTLCIQPEDGANLDAIIASKNWLDNSGSPATTARHIQIRNLGIDGGWRNRTTGTELQTAGDGHGIAGTPYLWTIENCDIGQTRGCNIFFDTTGQNGSTGLGEAIEPKVLYTVMKRAGAASFQALDSAGVSGGVTDGYLIGCVISHGNIRALTGQDGAAVDIETAGGWAVGYNHVYATDSFAGGSWAGYPTPQITHGFVFLAASGLRFFSNQCADFGYHRTTTSDTYGVWVRLDSDRPAIINDFNVWTDEDAGSIHDYYPVRVNTNSGERSGIMIDNVIAKSRAGSPTMRGFRFDASGGGSIYGKISNVFLEGVTIGQMLSSSGGGTSLLGTELIAHNVSWDDVHAVNEIAHTASGGVTCDSRLGRRQVVTLTANATSVTVTNLDDGQEVEVQFIASGGTRSVNFTSADTATDHTNPGNVNISDGGLYRARFVAVNGTDYLVDSQAVA